MKLLQKYFLVIIVGFILLGFTSCSEVKPPVNNVPSQLLTHDQMSDILADIHLMEAMDPRAGSIDTSVIQKESRYDGIFRKHHVSFDAFQESFRYYKLRPVDIDTIYSGVIQRLTDMEVRYNTKVLRKPVLLNPDSVSNH